MCPVPGPVKQDRSPSARERTARLLAQTARAQLREGGEMTVAAVAERAGVSRATAYRYFVSNDAVTVWATRPMTAEPDATEIPATPEPEELGDRAARLVRDQGVWVFEHELRALLALSLAPDAEQRGVSRRGKMRRSQWIKDAAESPSRQHHRRAPHPAGRRAHPPVRLLIAWIARTLVEATIRDP